MKPPTFNRPVKSADGPMILFVTWISVSRWTVFSHVEPERIWIFSSTQLMCVWDLRASQHALRLLISLRPSVHSDPRCSEVCVVPPPYRTEVDLSWWVSCSCRRSEQTHTLTWSDLCVFVSLLDASVPRTRGYSPAADRFSSRCLHQSKATTWGIVIYATDTFYFGAWRRWNICRMTQTVCVLCLNRPDERHTRRLPMLYGIGARWLIWMDTSVIRHIPSVVKPINK